MEEKDLLNAIASMLNNVKMDMESLLKAQEISNNIAISNNPQVPEETRNKCLMKALNLMGLESERDTSLDTMFR